MSNIIRDFTKKEKKLIQKHTLAILNMERRELEDFTKRWLMAKPDLDADIFKQVKDAIDIQEEDLASKINFSVVAENSELIEGDKGDLR